jgi:hypothetical protein
MTARHAFNVSGGSTRDRSRVVFEPCTELRREGLTFEQVAEKLRAEYDEEATITKNAVVAALLRRGAPSDGSGKRAEGLSPRTVRYIHTILHAALKDALRWNRVLRNIADAATPPSAAAAKSTRPKGMDS